MPDFNYLIPRQVDLNVSRPTFGDAFLRGFAGPLAISNQITQNQLAQEKLKQFQDTRNAMSEYAKTKDPGAFRGTDPELHMQLQKFIDTQPPETLKDLSKASAVVQQIAPMVNSASWKGGLHQQFTSAFPNLPPEVIPGPDATDDQLFKWANMSKLLDAQIKLGLKEPKVVGKSLVSATGQELYRGPEEKTTLIGTGGQIVGTATGKIHNVPQGFKPEIVVPASGKGPALTWTPGTQLPPGYTKPGALGSKLTSDNMDSIVTGVENGMIDPNQLSKRGQDYNTILAKLSNKGVNVGMIGNKWRASQRWISSLNSQQQGRLEAAGTRVVHTIDEVKRLADKMNLSGFTPANYAEIESKMRLAGNTPAGRLATQYVTAVNDLKEVFVNAVNGGYAPTDAAWKLVEKQINGNFGVKQMNASLDQVQRLMNININAGKSMREEAAMVNPVTGEGKSSPSPNTMNVLPPGASGGGSSPPAFDFSTLPIGKAVRVKGKYVGRFADGLYEITPKGAKLGRYAQ